MAFKEIFKDDNDINEKSVIGFISFIIMVVFALTDLLTGYLGNQNKILLIHHLFH